MKEVEAIVDDKYEFIDDTRMTPKIITINRKLWWKFFFRTLFKMLTKGIHYNAQKGPTIIKSEWWS
jgi:hypothetical protein